MLKHTWKIAIGLLIVATTACQDLEVVNPNEPDAERALAQPGDVEGLVATSWVTAFWGRTQGSASTVNALPLVADEFSGTYANNGALEMSSEPRVPYNNDPLADAGGLARFQWESWYSGISSANDGLTTIAAGLKITTGTPPTDNTIRTKAFAKYMQGVSHGYISSLFDRGFVATENTDLSNPKALKLLPYMEVRDSAVAMLAEAAAIAAANTFTLPLGKGLYFVGAEVKNDRFAQIINSSAARVLVYSARTPEERQALPWAKIIALIDAGVKADFTVELNSTNSLTSSYWSRFTNTGTFSAYGDYHLIGPSDVSGRYQAWLRSEVNNRTKFDIVTPDRRITGATPTSNGSLFRYRPSEIMVLARGTYHFSSYQWYGNAGRTTTGPLPVISLKEMNLYKAEGLLRTGRAAEAVPLINLTRVANGKLPAVTVAGPPQAADCVPRRDDGTCGDLMDALKYEINIELTGTDAVRAFFDRRGFGQLVSGTFLHLPVSARELSTLGLPLYTFGGVGKVGSAK
ncbi:MAG: hypothetical protein ABIS27_11490 [Longimicrobiales bacterium]